MLHVRAGIARHGARRHEEVTTQRFSQPSTDPFDPLGEYRPCAFGVNQPSVECARLETSLCTLTMREVR